MLETNHDKSRMNQNEIDYFLALSKVVPVGIFFADLQAICTYANDKLLDISGLRSSDLLQQNWIHYIHPEDQEKVSFTWTTAIIRSLPFKAEFRFLHKSGEVTWVTAQATPLINSSGIVGYAGTMSEISERLKEQEIARENADRFTNAFEYASIGMALISLDGGWLKVNQSVCDLFGYSKEELMQLNFQQLTHPDDLAKDLEYVHQLLDRKIKTYSMEKRYFTKAKEIVWAHLSVSLVRNQKGDPLYFISQIENITDRKHTEEELRKSEQRLYLATTSAKLGIWDLDFEGSSLQWNDEMYKIYGVDRKTFQPTFEAWKNSLHPEDADRSAQEFVAAVNGNKDFNIEFRILRPDGTIRNIKATATFVRKADGTALRMTGANHDITEDKKAMQRLEELNHYLVEARKIAENATILKSRFLDIAAHELRTPVTSFNLILQIAQRKLEAGQSVDPEVLTRLRMQGDRIARLVVDLLDVSRLERGMLQIKRESTDISNLINNCVAEFRLRHPHREIKFDQIKSILIKIDPVRIYQVVSNLIDNACKYTSENSPVEILIKDTPELVSVSVRDHGKGIPEEQQENLFKVFSRGSSDLIERSGGLGLGLFICKSLVDLHSGTIDVKSKLNEGSTFTFELPHEE